MIKYEYENIVEVNCNNEGCKYCSDGVCDADAIEIDKNEGCLTYTKYDDDFE